MDPRGIFFPELLFHAPIVFSAFFTAGSSAKERAHSVLRGIDLACGPASWVAFVGVETSTMYTSSPTLMKKFVFEREPSHSLPQFNMEPENGIPEEEIPFGNHDFKVPC